MENKVSIKWLMDYFNEVESERGNVEVKINGESITSIGTVIYSKGQDTFFVDIRNDDHKQAEERDRYMNTLIKFKAHSLSISIEEAEQVIIDELNQRLPNDFKLPYGLFIKKNK